MIKLNKYHVIDTATGHKARVTYSHFQMASTGEWCVTLYDKDYGYALGKIFPAEYRNNTDSMVDYFEKGYVRLMASHPLYQAAMARAS